MAGGSISKVFYSIHILYFTRKEKKRSMNQNGRDIRNGTDNTQ